MRKSLVLGLILAATASYAANFKVSYKVERNRFSNTLMNNIYIVSLQNNMEIKDVVVNRGSCKNSFKLLTQYSTPAEAASNYQAGYKIGDLGDAEYLKKYRNDILKAKASAFIEKNEIKIESIRSFVNKKAHLSDKADEEKLTQFYFDYLKKLQIRIIDDALKYQAGNANRMGWRSYRLGGILQVSDRNGCYVPDEEKDKLPKVEDILQKSIEDLCKNGDNESCKTELADLSKGILYSDDYSDISTCGKASWIAERGDDRLFGKLIASQSYAERFESLKKQGVKFKKVYETNQSKNDEANKEIWEGKKPAHIPAFKIPYQEVVSNPKTTATYKLDYGKQVMVSVPDMRCKILEVDIISNKGREKHKF